MSGEWAMNDRIRQWHKFRFFATRFQNSLIILMCVFSLQGCSGLSSLVSGDIDTKRINISAVPGANNDTPVAMDIVAVADDNLVQMFVGMDVKGWFSQKEKFVANRPNSINIRTFEVVPGQSIGDQEYSWSDRRKYKAVFIFAKMLSPGLHKMRIDSYVNPAIIIGKNSINVTEIEK
jgi:type VI secretion system protein